MINVYFIERDEYVERKPHTVTPKTFLKMSAEMEKYVYGNESTRYLREVSNKTVLAGDKMSRVMRKPVLGASKQVRHKPQKMARGLKFRI